MIFLSMEHLLGDFNGKLGRENRFNPTIGNNSLHQDSNDNGGRIVNFATSKNRVANSTTFRAETFLNTPGPILVRRFTTGLITY